MPLVILHHLLNVSVQLANKRGFKQKKLRSTVSWPVRLGVVPILERVTRCQTSLSDNYFFIFFYVGRLL
jgi:hypothetical protein